MQWFGQGQVSPIYYTSVAYILHENELGIRLVSTQTQSIYTLKSLDNIHFELIIYELYQHVVYI